MRGDSRLWGPREAGAQEGAAHPRTLCLEQQLRKCRGKLAPGVAVSLNREETTKSRVPQLALLLVQLFARQVTSGKGFHILRKQPQYRNSVNDKNAKQMRWWGSYSGGQWEPSRRALLLWPWPWGFQKEMVFRAVSREQLSLVFILPIPFLVAGTMIVFIFKQLSKRMQVLSL